MLVDVKREENMHDERYHYLESGLDDVYLVNGFKRFSSSRGTSIAISDVDQLHEVIGMYLCRQRKELRGSEIRFPRQEMLMSQSTLARLLEVTEQTIHRWEAEKSRMPRAAEAIVRLLYAEQTGNGRGSIRKRLKRLADFEVELDYRSEIVFECSTDEGNAAASRQQSARWKLAA